MSDEKKEYDPEMRGALYEDARHKEDEKYPVATGKVTISGVELRIAMWPSRVSSGEGRKKYWPIKVEYKQGATRFLVPVSPAEVTATGIAPAKNAGGGAAADKEQSGGMGPADSPADTPDVGDLPF